jgi:mannose-6-phosphate isomerase
MSELYPLKFEPILKQKVWGGSALVNRFNKKESGLSSVGESWEISAISGDISLVSNGFLAGNNLEELIEVYMGDITGDSVYEKFGNEFPLLIKLIEANEDLSVQVHPGNEMARERHNAYGKTEMWYILESKKDAKIYTGFKEGVTKEVYLKSVEEGTIIELLNAENVIAGDIFFVPAGTIHAIGAGVVLAEIQQTSDITYRIFDWNRRDNIAGSRELHTELALDAIDFSSTRSNRLRKDLSINGTANLINCEFFNTNLIWLINPIRKDYTLTDSFIIYICIEGELILRWDGNAEVVKKGQSVLLPAMIKEILLDPVSETKLLEIFIVEKAVN